MKDRKPMKHTTTRRELRQQAIEAGTIKPRIRTSPAKGITTREDWRKAFEANDRARNFMRHSADLDEPSVLSRNSTTNSDRVAMAALQSAARVVQSYVLLVGDLVTGFECYGPFCDGAEAVHWANKTGVRERVAGQWFMLPLKEPRVPNEEYKELPGCP